MKLKFVSLATDHLISFKHDAKDSHKKLGGFQYGVHSVLVKAGLASNPMPTRKD